MSEVLQKSAALGKENYEPRGHLDPHGYQQFIQIKTYLPPSDLGLFVDHFWTIKWDAIPSRYESEQVMHRPYVDLFITSTGERGIQGTFKGKRTYVAEGTGRIIGVRFRPGAFHALWDDAMAELQGKNLDVGLVFPEITDAYTHELLSLGDEVVTARLAELIRSKHPEQDKNIDLVNTIIMAVEADEELHTVAAVARAAGRSERWLQQLFQEYTGIGLKWLIQRHRLLSAAEQIQRVDNPDWTAIAYDLGYSSQQHFITDFKRILGKTPVKYKKELTGEA